MTREEAIRIIRKMLACTDLSVRANLNADMVDACHLAIKALEQEPTTKIEESNFSQEQYLADIQSAYDCGKSVIDKIQEEIKRVDTVCHASNNHDELIRRSVVLQIIDKYKAESEGTK